MLTRSAKNGQAEPDKDDGEPNHNDSRVKADRGQPVAEISGQQHKPLHGRRHYHEQQNYLNTGEHAVDLSLIGLSFRSSQCDSRRIGRTRAVDGDELAETPPSISANLKSGSHGSRNMISTLRAGRGSDCMICAAMAKMDFSGGTPL